MKKKIQIIDRWENAYSAPWRLDENEVIKANGQQLIVSAVYKEGHSLFPDQIIAYVVDEDCDNLIVDAPNLLEAFRNAKDKIKEALIYAKTMEKETSDPAWTEMRKWLE